MKPEDYNFKLPGMIDCKLFPWKDIMSDIVSVARKTNATELVVSASLVLGIAEHARWLEEELSSMGFELPEPQGRVLGTLIDMEGAANTNVGLIFPGNFPRPHSAGDIVRDLPDNDPVRRHHELLTAVAATTPATMLYLERNFPMNHPYFAASNETAMAALVGEVYQRIHHGERVDQ